MTSVLCPFSFDVVDWCLAIKNGVDFIFVCCDCVHVLILFVVIACMFPNNISWAFDKSLHFSESGCSPLQNQETMKCRASYT